MLHFLNLFAAFPLLLIAAMFWASAGPSEPVEFQLEGRGLKMGVARALFAFAMFFVANFVHQHIAMTMREDAAERMDVQLPR